MSRLPAWLRCPAPGYSHLNTEEHVTTSAETWFDVQDEVYYGRCAKCRIQLIGFTFSEPWRPMVNYRIEEYPQ